MLTKIKIWLLQLSNVKQLLILLICYWIFWFSTDVLLEVVWPAEYDDDPENLIGILVANFFMAIFFVLVFHFYKVKRLFKKKAV